MPGILSIQIDPQEREDLAAALNPKQLRSATFQAVKRTTAKMGKLVAGKVKEQTYINNKYIKRAIFVKPPRGDPPVGEVVITEQRLPLIAFRVRVSKKKGVTAFTLKGKPPIVYRHAFKATVRTRGNFQGEHEGHEGIFVRAKHLPTKGPNVGKGKLTPRGFAGRFAIVEQFGRSVFWYVNIPKVQEELIDEGQAEMRKQLVGQVDRFTKPKSAPLPPEPAADTP